MKNISYMQALEFVNSNNALLIDVQTEGDFSKKHLPGSINIPLQIIEKKIFRKTNDKNRYIIVSCQKGIKSTSAAYLLEELGFKNVFNIKGGFDF